MRNNFRATFVVEDNIPEFEGRMRRAMRSLTQEFENTGRTGSTAGLTRGLNDARSVLAEVDSEIQALHRHLQKFGDDPAVTQEVARLTKLFNAFEASINQVDTAQRRLRLSTKELAKDLGDSLGKGTQSVERQVKNLKDQITNLSRGFKIDLAGGTAVDPNEFRKLEAYAEQRRRVVQGLLTRVDKGSLTRTPEQVQELRRQLDDIVKLRTEAAHRAAEFEIQEMRRVERERAQHVQRLEAQQKQQRQQVNAQYGADRRGDYLALNQRIEEAQSGGRRFKTAAEVQEARFRLSSLRRYIPKEQASAELLGFDDPATMQVRLREQSLFLRQQQKDMEQWESMGKFQRMGAWLAGKRPGGGPGPSFDMKSMMGSLNHRVTNVSQLMGYSLYGLGAFGAATGLVKGSVGEAMQAEQMQTTLAGLLNTYMKFKNVAGEIVSPAENFNKALERSKTLYMEIRKEAEDSILNSRELSQYYATSAGFGFSAGLNDRQVMRVVERGGVLGKALGLRETDTAQDLRSLLQKGGRLDSTNKTAQMLGITAKMRDEALAAGPDAFMKMFEEKFKGLNPALDRFANSFTNKVSAFVEKLQQVGLVLGEGMIPSLTPLLNDLRRDVDDWVSSGRAAKFARDLGGMLQAVGGVFTKFTQFLASNVQSPLQVVTLAIGLILANFVKDMAVQRLAASGAVGGFIGVLALLVTGIVMYKNKLEKEAGDFERRTADFMESRNRTDQEHRDDQGRKAEAALSRGGTTLGGMMKLRHGTGAEVEGAKVAVGAWRDLESGTADLTKAINAERAKRGKSALTVDQVQKELFGSNLGNPTTKNMSWFAALNVDATQGGKISEMAGIGFGGSWSDEGKFLESVNPLKDKIRNAQGLLQENKGNIDAAMARELENGGKFLTERSGILLKRALEEAKKLDPSFNLTAKQADDLYKLSLNPSAKITDKQAAQYSTLARAYERILKSNEAVVVPNPVEPKEEKDKPPKIIQPSYSLKALPNDLTPVQRAAIFAGAAVERSEFFQSGMAESTPSQLAEKALALQRVVEKRKALAKARRDERIAAIPNYELFVGETRMGGDMDAIGDASLASPQEIQKWAQECPPGLDCSAFIQAMAARMGKRVPRTAIQQYKYTKRVSPDQLAPGDLVFFDNKRRDAYNTVGKKEGDGYVNHVGMYLGNGMFIDDPGRSGDTRKPKNLAEYLKRTGYTFMGGGRMGGVGKGGVGMVLGPTDADRLDRDKKNLEAKKQRELAEVEYRLELEKIERQYGRDSKEYAEKYAAQASGMYATTADETYRQKLHAIEAEYAKSPKDRVSQRKRQQAIAAVERQRIEDAFRVAVMTEDRGSNPLAVLNAGTRSFSIDDKRLQERMAAHRNDPNSKAGQEYRKALADLDRNSEVERIELDVEEQLERAAKTKEKEAKDHEGWLKMQGIQKARDERALAMSRLSGPELRQAQFDDRIAGLVEALDLKQANIQKLDPTAAGYEDRKAEFEREQRTILEQIQVVRDNAEALRANTSMLSQVVTIESQRLQQRIQTGNWESNPFPNKLNDLQVEFAQKYGGLRVADLREKLLQEGANPGLVQALDDRSLQDFAFQHFYRPRLQQIDTARARGAMHQGGIDALGTILNGGDPVRAFASTASSFNSTRMQGILGEFMKGRRAFRTADGKFSKSAMQAGAAEFGASYVVGNFLNKNSYAQEGGQIGSLIGALTPAAGPYGAAIGMLAGALGGSFFKKKQADPADVAYRRTVTELLSRISKDIRPVGDYYKTRTRTFATESAMISGRSLGFGDMMGAH